MFVFCTSVRWKYGYTSILEVHIRRVSHMWSWSNMKQHRENLRSYKSAYKNKLLCQSKLSPDAERHIQVLLHMIRVQSVETLDPAEHKQV